MTTKPIIKRLTGTVKWFNNKVGFGFITVCNDGEYNNKDVFVHYTSIRVTNSQYKYLVQGEYVDFTLSDVSDSTHEYQASDVSGVHNGPIMCESKNLPLADRHFFPKTKWSKEKQNEYMNNIEKVKKDRDYADNLGFVKVENKRSRSNYAKL